MIKTSETRYMNDGIQRNDIESFFFITYNFGFRNIGVALHILVHLLKSKQ